MTDDVLRLNFWLNNQASGVKNSSIYVCHYGKDPHAYAMAVDGSIDHCADPECIAAHRLAVHEKARQQSQNRYRAVMALRTA